MADPKSFTEETEIIQGYFDGLCYAETSPSSTSGDDSRKVALMADANPFSEVTEVIQDYFDGLYYADTKRLAKVFHPDARYVNMIDGDYMNKPRAAYFEMVDGRISPASKGQVCENRIYSIEFGGSNMAFVRASVTMSNREFLDFLTLTHDDNGWRIMTKMFTFIPKTQEA